VGRGRYNGGGIGMTAKELYKRRGTIDIPLWLLQEYPTLVLRFMKDKIVYRAEILDYGNTVRYDVVWKGFDILECGIVPPPHEILVECKELKFDRIVEGRKHKKGDRIATNILLIVDGA
jgi:hypothetical protein